MTKCRNQGANCGTAAVEASIRPIEASSVEFIPLCRDFCGNAANLIDVHFFSACKSRLERIPACHMVVDTVPGITPRRGKSGKFHSPALKQYPWSMNVALYFARRFAWRLNTA